MNPGASPRDFALDRFQIEALAAIDAGRSVVVSAPTGSGKTVVAEHAVRVALDAGEKAFYTTPIKALSNQKYRDLVAVHGLERVGLLTGDNAVRPDAPVVVMTTEVLRNMLYARSPLLRGVGWVVLDEVHFLEDPYRGPVWEEIVIHLPHEVGLVCLSATVSNAEELAGWIGTVHGSADLVVEHRRPVPLEHRYVVGERQRRTPHIVATLQHGKPNPEGAAYDAFSDGRARGGRPRHRWVTPRRAEVVEALRRRQLLPAIYFLFSRAGCDDAARALSDTGVDLVSGAERDRIAQIVHDHVRDLDRDEAETLAVRRWLRMLQRGIAAHHAGMVPPLKEAVEACFVEGLVKVVFATETLALGVNMPARTVVIERLTKFGGEDHQLLTPSQYTQLSGRAGRRGIDERGEVWVLWSPWVRFDQAAGLAASRSFELRSAFRPNYNMAANLIHRHDRPEALALLRSSFGQYQASRLLAERVAEAADQRRAAEALERELAARLPADRDWRGLLDAPTADREAVEAAVRALRPGDAVRLGGEAGVVLTTAQRGPFTQVTGVDAQARSFRVHSTALDELPLRLGVVELPEPFLPLDTDFRRQAAARLRRLVGATTATPTVARGLRRRARKLQRMFDAVGELEAALDQGESSLVGQFDAVVAVLEAWDHVRGWALTARGQVLRGIYHESDLLVSEALHRGVFDGLGPPDLAGVVAALVYERRGPGDPPEVWYPTARLRGRFEDLERCWDDLSVLETAHALPVTRRPDPGGIAMAQAWAAGGDLDEVLADEELSGGDFVRVVKMLMDLLGQMARVAPVPATAEAAGAAVRALRRGVVAASSVAPEPESEPEADAEPAPESESAPESEPGSGAP